MTPDSLDPLFGPQAAFRHFLSRTNQKANIGAEVGTLLNVLDPSELPDDVIVLDAGCGEGKLSSLAYAKIRSHSPDLTYIGIDPSQHMLVLFCEEFRRNQPANYRVIHGRFFDRPEFSIDDLAATVTDGTPKGEQTIDALREQNPDLFAAKPLADLKGKVGILFCAHTLYYAQDMAKAWQDSRDMLSPNGFCIFVHQSATSQMHKLRKKYSESPLTLRQPDGEPNCADHMTTASGTQIPIIDYSSDLFFPEDFKTQFALLRELLTAQTPKSDWARAAQEKGIDSASFAATCGVLQYILRQEFGAMDQNLSGFLTETEELLDYNPKLDGKPRLFIRESIVLAATNERTIGHLKNSVAVYQQEALKGAFLRYAAGQMMTKT